MCSTKTVKILFCICFVVLAGNTLLLGQKRQGVQKEPPKVLTAVAPRFIPFVFDNPGVNEVVVEVRLDHEGKVTAARTVSASLFKDGAFELAARQWIFEASKSKRERYVHIKFVMRIMPEGTSSSEITTIYRYPAELELRRDIFKAQITTSPLF